MPKATVRSTSLRNQTLGTPWGRVELDSQGFPTNLEELGITAEQLLTRPGFINTEVFPTKDQPELPKPVVKTNPTVVQPPSSALPTDEDITAAIEGVYRAGDKPNAEGYVNMGPLIEALKAKNLKGITGTKRKEVENKMPHKQTPPLEQDYLKNEG